MKYSDAGVDVDKADEAMKSIKGMVKSTFNKQVLADFGSFGGLFSLQGLAYKEPVLVASTDGVGTKLRIGISIGDYKSPGQDIVNHCVDDILVQGAKPLFFLDYFATGKLQPPVLEGVISGLSLACRENGCVLLGGETAEMPGIYHGDDFDLAGTIVGIVEKDHLITGSSIQAGDQVLALFSSGLHTNGYSLARKVLLEKAKYDLNAVYPGLPGTLGSVLAKPHRSYLRVIEGLIPQKLIQGMVHITGGGFQGNIPRILPKDLVCNIKLNSWTPPEIFSLIQREGEVDPLEMLRTFNMGIGLLLVVHPQDAALVKAHLNSLSEPFVEIGNIAQQASSGQSQVVFLDD